MSKSFAVLPCNGLDKSAGCIAREIALNLIEKSDSEMICPVLYRVADARYTKIAQEKPLLVIDGCQTRCASKLASEKGLKVTAKITVTEEAKNRGFDLGDSLRLGENEVKLAEMVADELLLEKEAEKASVSETVYPETYNYEVYKKDKFIFRVPKEGFLFNENDSWVYISGNKARVGVTDYVQQSLSDIMFFTPPVVGQEVEQFGELGTVESGKAVFEVVSPVSGRITAVNEELSVAPELINQNPYEKGWIAEVELSDLESDKEFLLEFDGYFAILKRKVDDFHV
ncbi:Glycine cleavage system H protein [Candidatus Desulfosporosinus infrequens]|uniref:Glycine cleavage system H protein n=1 Tax=Candidatus Desulfosporosinus infrequens TaxID=2043169 RepID=A0A2U3K2N4_9FIRM|nr:Glycine cleavage system H protein [Candidatus Desulfosporosinus infrequens]